LKENKRVVRETGFYYLSLKLKKVKTYRRYVGAFELSRTEHFVLNDRYY